MQAVALYNAGDVTSGACDVRASGHWEFCHISMHCIYWWRHIYVIRVNVYQAVKCVGVAHNLRYLAFCTDVKCQSTHTKLHKMWNFSQNMIPPISNNKPAVIYNNVYKYIFACLHYLIHYIKNKLLYNVRCCLHSCDII